jgi:hypothetical protein
MTLDVLPFPADADPCAVLACDKRTEPIRECWRAGCGFEWARAAAEDRKAREAKDAARRAEG